MVCTAITAAAFVVLEPFANDEEDNGGAAVRPIMDALVLGLASGPALGLLLAVPIWRWRGFRFPTFAGEWMSLAVGVIIAHELARRLFLVWCRFDPGFGAGVSPRVFDIGQTVSYAGQVFCYLLGTILVRGVHWRLSFLLLLTANVPSLLLYTTSLFDEGVPTSWDRVLYVFFWFGAFLVIPVVSACVVDVVQRRRLPWTHWLGVGLFFWCHVWQYAGYVWLVYFSDT